MYFDLSDDDQSSIVLRPLIASVPPGFEKRTRPAASSYMFLKVTLEDDPSGLQIANWLKSFPPRVIRGVDIEGLILKARRLEDLNTQDVFYGSTLGKLSQVAQTEILQQLCGLTQVVSNTAVLASQAKGNTNHYNTDSSVAQNTIDDIQDRVSSVCESIEGGILLDPAIDLREAVEDDLMTTVGAKHDITLRRKLLDASFIPECLEIPRSTLEFELPTLKTQRQRFRFAKMMENSVLIESFHYTPVSPNSTEAFPNTIYSLKRMVGQLSHEKRTDYHILHCVGYIHEPLVYRFGVVFAISHDCVMEGSPYALSDLYSIRRRVPLDQRVHLAYTLGVALGNFHRVGWVHKEIKSSNICFLERTNRASIEVDQDLRGPASINFTHPWLFGFECSRPEDGESSLSTDYSPKNNAYRHPERWGKPFIKFEKYHDVYSLVGPCASDILSCELGSHV